jgi:site-specific DNA-adenine methylase
MRKSSVPRRGRDVQANVLRRLEDVIETSESWQAEAARALLEIRDKRLYGEKFNRSTHKPHAHYWRDRIEKLEAFAERLRPVVIESLDALDCIAKYDSDHTVFYVDPPYPSSARSDAGPTYSFEMTEDDHVHLLEVLKKVKAKVILSGGDSPVYRTHLRDWRCCYKVQVPCGSGGSKVGRYATTYRSEMLWANF